MKQLIILTFLVVSLNIHAQQVEVIKSDDLQKKILHTEASLTVFNFWATWCGPCIKELPYFEEIGDQGVKVYLVSVDFVNDLKKVQTFTEKRKLRSDVLFMDEKDPDSYMRKISDDWSGAIPATLFVTETGETFFHEKAFTREELQETVKKYVN